MISADRLHQIYKQDPGQVAKAMLAVLKDFGYDSLTLTYVGEVLGKIAQDDPTTGVIAMWIKGWWDGGLD